MFDGRSGDAGNGRAAGWGGDDAAAAGAGATWTGAAAHGGRDWRQLDRQLRRLIAYTVCPDCARGWHDVPGRSIEVSPGAIEQAACDCVVLDRVDGDVPPAPARSIPAAVRRMVRARDHHRCTIPGCRSALFVDLHHIRWRSRDGELIFAALRACPGPRA